MATINDLIAKVERLQQTVETLANQQLQGRRILTAQGLSDIDSRLGMILAGELRFGNRVGTFTGLKLGYPAFTASGKSVHLAGLSSDALKFGIRSSDGVALADRVHLMPLGADPAYEDGYAILYYFLSGATRQLKVRRKDGASELTTVVANI